MKYTFFLLLFFTLSSPKLWSQGASTPYGSLTIDQVILNERTGYVDLYLKAFNTDNTDLFPLLEGLTIYDRRGLYTTIRQENSNRVDTLSIIDFNLVDQLAGDQVSSASNPRILFLLDLSGSMRGEKIELAKSAIREALQSDALRGCTVEFAWFHNRVSPSRSVNRSTYESVVGIVNVGPEGEGKDTDLYRAVKSKVEEYTIYPGPKVIILLTDGENDIKNNPLYRGPKPLTPISQQELLTFVANKTASDSLLKIYPVGIGTAPDRNFLESLAGATINPNDDYWPEITPEEINATFQKIIRDESLPNFIVSVIAQGDNATFDAGRPEFTVGYYTDYVNSKNLLIARKTAPLGSTGVSRIADASQQHSRWETFFLGFVILAVLLSILAFSVPILSDKKFQKEHVKKYWEIREQGRTKSDPLTQKPFEDHDTVVTDASREKVMSLSTWKYYREGNKQSQVGKFIELFPPQVKGSEFFSQRGVFRRLNWLWFGAAGGFFAWIVWALLQLVDKKNYLQQLTVLDNDQLQISTSVLEQTVLGVAMGAGIVFALALAEERGQSRKFNFGRILLRMLIGMLAAYVIFFAESALMAKFVPLEWLRYMIGWTLFGTALGWVITFFSSIEPLSGLKGGAIAGFIGFLVYYLLISLIPPTVIPRDYVQIIGYITYGGVLGYTLHTVVSSLEAYELRCISPSNFSGWQSPISKWLKASDIDFISIGKHPKNRVYIKWDDSEVAAHHARLSLIKEVPHITPDGGGVMVNNRPIANPTPLANGDRIQLGAKSITVLQFVAKEQKDKMTNTSRSGSDDRRLNVKKRSARDTEKIRKQIKINRK